MRGWQVQSGSSALPDDAALNGLKAVEDLFALDFAPPHNRRAEQSVSVDQFAAKECPCDPQHGVVVLVSRCPEFQEAFGVSDGENIPDFLNRHLGTLGRSQHRIDNTHSGQPERQLGADRNGWFSSKSL